MPGAEDDDVERRKSVDNFPVRKLEPFWMSRTRCPLFSCVFASEDAGSHKSGGQVIHPRLLMIPCLWATFWGASLWHDVVDAPWGAVRVANLGQVDKMDLVGSVEDSDVIIVDDMIDTAGTLCKAASVLKACGGECGLALAEAIPARLRRIMV